MGLPVQINKNLHIQLSHPAQQGKEASGKRVNGRELLAQKAPYQEQVDTTQVKAGAPKLYWQGPGKPLTTTRPDPQASADVTKMMKAVARAVAGVSLGAKQ
mgnify:CR=1 FL=1